MDRSVISKGMINRKIVLSN